MAKTDCCRNCVYGCWDGGLWLRTLWSGFPAGPMCANHPDTPGILREVPGRPCRNYRRKPPEPGAEAKRIILTNGMVAYVDAADYEELSRYTWHLASGGYAGRYEKRVLILMHRQIMNPPEGMVVDHIKGNRLDNTRAHLRVCTPSENARNRSKCGNATSQYFGVCYNKRRRKWIASIKVEGRVKEVGFSYDEKEAARAYDYAAVRNFGDYVRLNFPEEWPPERRAQVRATRHAESVERKRNTKKAAAKGESDAKRRTPAARRVTKSKQPTGHRSRATASKRPRRKTRHAKRTTKPGRTTGHKPRPTRRQRPPTGRQR
ncbi:MAG: HNH endonuclease [Phycisphaerales bacterium]